MPVESAAALTDALCRGRLLETAQQAVLPALEVAFPEPHALAGELIRRAWLTPYQINQIFQGRGDHLLLGSYVLLERLGEGGMGQVFKARNWKLGQVVALKLIRKEQLDNPNAVRRFHREIRAVAQLNHPNIVRAFDAVEVNGTHLLVMEYVQGADLAKMVRHGPLPVGQACDCCRQAALGLQHAFERGMVHRDIKPHNLLLTLGGVVKILDMGLARLDRREGEATATMTREGAVMGTLDYISPEQAMDSHEVDIRADLYSLGCTLYFLLTGKPPFPGGEALQKLLKHRLDEPVPVEQLRPDVLPGVAAVVRKLMAKRPEDRYQTPAEAAAALALAAGAKSPTDAIAAASPIRAGGRAEDATAAWSGPAAELPTDWAVAPRRRRPAGPSWFWAGAGAVVGAGILALGLLGLYLASARPAVPTAPVTLVAVMPPPPVVAPPPNRAAADAFDEWVRRTADLPADRQVAAVAAKLQERNADFDGRATPTIENGVVVRLDLVTDIVTDLSPVRALPGLRRLGCRGHDGGTGRLSDLAPLKDMKLTNLDCFGTQVADLSPLKGTPLVGLCCGCTPVADLSPLRGKPLTFLDCGSTRISDLAPVKGMPLTTLYCPGTGVSDLGPLTGMPLTSLDFNNTAVSDLSPLAALPLADLNFDGARVSDLAPLKGLKVGRLSCRRTGVVDLSPLKEMPLKELDCDIDPKRDAAILRSIPTLETINGKPAADFWKAVGDSPP